MSFHIPQVLIHSNEPLWIDYGIFPRLPHEGEDIYCDSLAFRLGYGYDLSKKLNTLGVETGWCLQYAEPVFQALAKSQAQRDEVSNSLVEICPTHPTPLAVSAPLRSGDHRTVIADTHYDLNTSWLMEADEKPSWLVLWNWLMNEKLHEIIPYCQQKKIAVCLGITQDENTGSDIEKVVSLLKGVPAVEVMIFHRPPYLPMTECGWKNSFIELLQDDIPVIMVEKSDGLQITSSTSEQKTTHTAANFIEWISFYIHHRQLGNDIVSAVGYAQSKFR